mgnify:CR=1 FL=1
MPVTLPEKLQKIQIALGSATGEIAEKKLVEAVKTELPLISDQQALEVVDGLIDDIQGFGKLDKLITTPGVTDVLVNGPDQVWYDCGSGLQKADVQWKSEQELRDYVTRLASLRYRRLDENQPFVDVRLHQGVRMHAIIPPLSQSGTCVSFRIPNQQARTLNQLMVMKMFDDELCNLLKWIMQSGVSFLICGGTGSGKTTLLGAMLNEVASDERIVVVEDLFELQLSHNHVINLQARQPNVEGNGEVSMRQLVRQTLRMRPNRIVVGEVRGVEILDLFTALNTGHTGGCATIHANSAHDVSARIEALGLLAGIPSEATHRLFGSAIKLIIELGIVPSVGRRVNGIYLAEYKNKQVSMSTIWNQHSSPNIKECLDTLQSLIAPLS